MFEVKSVAEVIINIHDNFSGRRLAVEVVHIREATGRILACAVTAGEDIPGFHRSAVDGYAVIASDTFGCGESLPAQLELAGEVIMGRRPSCVITAGRAAYIPTGGELPENSNAVVMIEYAEDLNDGYIYLNKPVAPGNNVVFKGDDIKTGETVMEAGRRLRPRDIGTLAALGIETVAVKKRLRVGILATGDEVVDIRQKLTGSQVRDVNSHVLYGGLLEYGAEPLVFGIVGDGFEKLQAAVERALPECDLLLISGGSSVGARDETYKVINAFADAKILAHGIAIKPGKPTIIAKIGDKAVFGLPGHPASAFFIFKLIVTPLMDMMNDAPRKVVGTVKADMLVNYPSNQGREEYVPVLIREIDGKSWAEPIFGKSGLIKLLSGADGYVKIERGSEGVGQGQPVEVILF